MDSVRFIMAIVLMIAVIFVTNLVFEPTTRSHAPAADTTATPAPVGADTLGAAVQRAEERQARTPPPQQPQAAAQATTPAVAPPAQRPKLTPAPAVTVESPLYSYGISTRGAGIVSARLSEYKDEAGTGPVELVKPGAGPLVSYRIRTGDTIVDLSRLEFKAQPAGGLELRPGSGPRTLHLVHADSLLRVEIDYTFQPDRYVATVHGTVQRAGATPQLLIDLGPTLKVNEADPQIDYRALAYVVKNQQEGVKSVDLSKVDARRIAEGPLDWAALKNKYFVAAVLAAQAAPQAVPLGGLIAQPVSMQHAASLTATLPIGRDDAWDLRLYLGPQESDRLSTLGLGDVNPYGWSFLQPVIRPLARVITWAVVGLHRVLNLSYGWVLVLIGVLVTVVLWPLRTKAMRSQMRNMEIQPRLKEIQEKYKSEPDKLQKEVMRLYKEEGFNPLGGCLPMLIPMPVLFALYFVFEATIEFRGVPFLWLPDLSRPDPLYVLPVLLGVGMFLQQWLNMRTTTKPNPQMKVMMYVMPLVWVFLFLRFAAGLNLYYATTYMAGIPQQLQLVRERKRAAESKR